MDVKLVFVMEGKPPKLKADVMSKRNQIRYGPSGKTCSQKTGRSHFKSVLKECLDMLECLGIPWVQAAGEAEAMCAYLNASGYADGCLTNDGDAFLYGAQTVYRNFTMNTKVVQEFLMNKDKLVKEIRIIKTRIRNGVHCFEIEWEKPEHYAMEDEHGELVLQTIEEESLFEAAYPEIVAIYQKQKSEIKGKKQKGMKIKSKGSSLPESDTMMSFQSHTTFKPTCEIFSKQSSKLNLEIFPDSMVPQESISASLDTLLLPEEAPCLDRQEQLVSSLRPSATQQIKAVTAESSQPSTSSHSISTIANLHLSTIDWEGTSFSNSPAIPKNTFSHGPKSELETAIPDSFKNITEQLSRESEWYTTSTDKLLDWNLQKTAPEEHLLSGITGLHLQDLPLRERIHIKSSYPQNNVQPDVGLKTLSLLTVKEHCVANSSSDGLSHLSKDLLGINLQNESRNCKVLKGDQLFQENYKANTSIPYSLNNPIAGTSSVRTEPSNTAFNRSRKVDAQITEKIVMKKSVCLDRPSSEEESVPEFGKAKFTTRKMKQSSQQYSPAGFKKNDGNKLNNPKAHRKETEQCVQVYKTAGNEENSFPDAAKVSLSFLQCHKEKDNSGTYLDSPLPLSQRLKLRFQNT
ncbi:flap endonuclease GEN 1-like protein [Camelus ferus]|nr:flap endonuclease GEN 1-like protein [Camelus ferus]